MGEGTHGKIERHLEKTRGQARKEHTVIEAEVHRNDEVLMLRTYTEPSLSLETVLKQLEMYVVAEQLNHSGECLLRVRFAQTPKGRTPGQAS